MKKFAVLLFGAVMAVLLVGSIETTSADHLESDGNSLLAAMQKANIAVALPDSKYQIHLQTVIRDEDGYLIQVSESTSAAFVPHKLTDQVFDTLMGKVKPVTIDGIEYDKVTFTFIPAPISSRIAGIPSGVAGTLFITFGTLRRENSRFASSTVPFVS